MVIIMGLQYDGPGPIMGIGGIVMALEKAFPKLDYRPGEYW